MERNAQKRRILDERAARLARVLDEKASETREDWISIHVGTQRLAIEMQYVREVIPLAEITAIPATAECIAGLVNVRGELLIVVDLISFFNIHQGGITDYNKVVIIEHLAMTRGCLVSAAEKAQREQVLEDMAVHNVVSEENKRYFKGITSSGTLLLDMSAMMSDKRIKLLR